MGAFIDFQAEIWLAVFLLLLEIIKKIVEGIQSLIDRKNDIKPEEKEESKNWIEHHCNVCFGDLEKEYNVCPRCGKWTPYGALRSSVEIQKQQKKIEFWPMIISIILIVAIIALFVTGRLNYNGIFDDSDSLLSGLIATLRQDTIGIVCYIGVLICGLFFIITDWIYDHFYNRCINYFVSSLGYYAHVVKTGKHISPEITPALREKHAKEHRNLFPDKKTLIKSAIIRGVIYLVVVAVAFIGFLILINKIF